MKTHNQFTKSFSGWCLLSLIILLFSGCEKDKILFSDFEVTQSLYAHNSDWDQAILTELGTQYKVADWNDLKDLYKNGGDLLSLFNNLGLTAVGTDVSLEYNGVRKYSDTRYYYATRHEHNKPSGYLAHDQIDNYLISLGSWTGTRKILAIKK